MGYFENKKMYYEMELKKISAIINSHAQYIREYEKSIKIFNPEVIRLRVQEKIAEESEKITAIIKELRIEENGYILLVNEKTRKYIHPNPKFHNKSIDIYEKRKEYTREQFIVTGGTKGDLLFYYPDLNDIKLVVNHVLLLNIFRN